MGRVEWRGEGGSTRGRREGVVGGLSGYLCLSLSIVDCLFTFWDICSTAADCFISSNRFIFLSNVAKSKIKLLQPRGCACTLWCAGSWFVSVGVFSWTSYKFRFLETGHCSPSGGRRSAAHRWVAGPGWQLMGRERSTGQGSLSLQTSRPRGTVEGRPSHHSDTGQDSGSSGDCGMRTVAQ